MESTSSPKQNDEKTKIRSAGLEDQASSVDYLGFEPYVKAIYSFLENEHTKPPFTLSIEGDWGSGKSSFMLQLQQLLTAKKAIVINFNAWRHDKVESMWATFALTFIQQLESKTNVFLRPFLNLIVIIKRFDWRKGWSDLLLKLILLGLYGLLAYAFILRDGLKTVLQFLLVKDGKVEGLDLNNAINSLGFIGLVLGSVFVLKKITDIFGNPLTIDLSKYISRPDYSGHSSFIEAFHADFDKAVKVWAFNKKKVYVFIDDLDRAEIPKAAELMQGLNMMISDSPKIIFIIGMDRAKVAAGVAAKYKDMLKFFVSSNSSSEVRQALIFGSSFLQKFIQLSFRIPVPTPKDVKKFIDSINEAAPKTESKKRQRKQIHSIMLEDGEDAATFKRTVELMAPYFDYNPRLLKQFINGFRLKCHIAWNTGLFSNKNPMTIPQIGKFVAMIMLWPDVIDDLARHPSLVKELVSDPLSGESSDSAWRLRTGFVEFLKLKPEGENDTDEVSVNPNDFDMKLIDYQLLIKTSPAIMIPTNVVIPENKGGSGDADDDDDDDDDDDTANDTADDTDDSDDDYGLSRSDSSEKQSSTESTTTTESEVKPAS